MADTPEVALWSLREQMEDVSINDLDTSKVPVTAYVEGYENPVAWYEKFKINKNQLTKDVLFDNKDMRDITLAQYGSDKPEYIKWKL